MALTILEPQPAANSPARLALWDLGFRPFYLLAAVQAALAVPLWAMEYAGWLGPSGAPRLGSALWHAHGMVFGFAFAVITGFLFTAGRNWSGRPTPSGRALMLLAALWVAGRVLLYTPWVWLAALADAAFALGAAGGLARALMGAGNRRNYFFVALLLGLGAAGLAVHLAIAGRIAWSASALLQVGLDLVLFAMVVMGGRVIPMFTANGVPGVKAVRKPWVERTALASVLLLLCADLVGVPGDALAALCLVAALSHALRLAGWQPWRTLRHPLVWVLHVAYAWIVAYLALRAAAAAGLVAPGVATHALTAGAIGGLTLGMMTRTARGHSGLPLRAGAAELAAYLLVNAAAVTRVLCPLVWPGWTLPALLASGVLWSAAFAAYLWRYTPMLVRPRADGRPL